MPMKVVSFRLGGELFGIDISCVREIIKPMKPVKLPETKDYIEGVIDLRGTVLPIIDLRKRLNFPPSSDQGKERIIVVELGKSSLVGFHVDAVENVVDVDEERMDKNASSSISSRYVKGIVKCGDELMTIIDVNELVGEEERRELAAKAEGNAMEKNERKEEIATQREEIREDPYKEMMEEFERIKGKYVIPESEIRKLIDLLDAIKKGDFYRELNIQLYGAIGELAKKINELKKSLQVIDPKIKEIATEKIPQASDQLEAIIKETEEAAFNIMSRVEKLMDMVDELYTNLENLKLSYGEDEKIKQLEEKVTTMQNLLTEVLTALSFQDLTGQKIKRIIQLIKDMEKRILELVVSFGIKIKKMPQKKEEEEKVLDTIKEDKVSQDEVDEILSKFGF